ncbi:hypothetical protein D3C84_648090 [compost metagenome]
MLQGVLRIEVDGQRLTVLNPQQGGQRRGQGTFANTALARYQCDDMRLGFARTAMRQHLAQRLFVACLRFCLTRQRDLGQ